MDKFRISVIVPVYNRARTIETCVDGIFNSPTDDFEVILVDDGSTDDSLAVCEKLAQKYPRIKVVHQENGGVSAARNTGIEYASGEYIAFVDSDDTLFPNAISNVVSYVSEGGYDILFLRVSFIKVKKSGKFHLLDSNGLTSIKNEVAIYGNKDLVEWVFGSFVHYRYNFFFFVCNKVFRKSLIDRHNIRFSTDVSLDEDQIFVCNALKYANSLRYDGHPYYATLKWGRAERTYSLGEDMRTPSDYLHCQKACYRALRSLFDSSAVESVKSYATNYIVDRPITRVLYKSISWYSQIKVTYKELKVITETIIKSLLEIEASNLDCVSNRQVAAYAENIIEGRSFWRIYISIFFNVNIVTIPQQLLYFAKCIVKRCLRLAGYDL